MSKKDVSPQSPDSPQSPVSAELLVAADGSGAYRSINEAISAAREEAVIRVRPGLYRERLLIEKLVTIIGEGPAGGVVVESDGGECLVCLSHAVAVKGLTLRCTAGAKGLKVFAVEVLTRLLLEECDITGDSLACIGIHGAEVDPIFRRCKIHDGKQAGVLLYEQARGLFENCEIAENTLADIEIRFGSDPIVRRCRIFSVVISDQGRGTFEECDIGSSTMAAIEVRTGGDPVVRRCLIHESEECGVLVSAQGRGTFEDCDIFDNDASGVELKEGADSTVRRCRIHDGKAGGVMVWQHARGTFEECDIFANTLAGVEVREGGDPIVRRCTFYHGHQAGVLVSGDGRGTFEECNIFADRRVGMGIWDRGNPTVRRCKIHDNRQSGVMVFKQGTATFEECQLWGNNGKNFDIRDGCEVQRSGVVER